MAPAIVVKIDISRKKCHIFNFKVWGEVGCLGWGFRFGNGRWSLELGLLVCLFSLLFHLCPCYQCHFYLKSPGAILAMEIEPSLCSIVTLYYI